MIASTVDYKNVQGLVRFGHKRLTEASFLLLKIRDASAARSWLEAAPVMSAVDLGKAPDYALQLAFTRDGLRAIGLAEDILAGFSLEFLSGMAGEESRSRRLGDVDESAPEYWRWGGPLMVPDLLVMLYARPGLLESWTATIQGSAWDAAFEVLDSLSTSNLDGVEPFGFVDGISEPALDWNRSRVIPKDELEYGNLAALGEFLLGYPNEYGKYTDRPLLDPSDPTSSVLPFAEDVPRMRDLGRDGTYLIFRQLEQDVRGFWRFVDQKTGSDPIARRQLAEAMVGRKMNGDPLEPLSDRPITGVDDKSAARNQFTYDEDANGTRCPFGAHVRRANPRNADLPAGSLGLIGRLLHTLGFGNTGLRDDILASTRFHRLLRRGREYGPGLSVEEAIAGGPDDGERGLHFICIAANISRQFEFVQNAWLASTKFNALTEESDPLLGSRQAVPGCPFTDTFSIPNKEGARTRITDLPRFITVRGGGYFFLPSLSALRYLSSLRSQVS